MLYEFSDMNKRIELKRHGAQSHKAGLNLLNTSERPA